MAKAMPVPPSSAMSGHSSDSHGARPEATVTAPNPTASSDRFRALARADRAAISSAPPSDPTPNSERSRPYVLLSP